MQEARGEIVEESLGHAGYRGDLRPARCIRQRRRFHLDGTRAGGPDQRLGQTVAEGADQGLPRWRDVIRPVAKDAHELFHRWHDVPPPFVEGSGWSPPFRGPPIGLPWKLFAPFVNS